jgi:3-methyl-2-oxobutanoate hydroxymethyltransferase
LTPQTAVALGGYRAQGRTVQSAQRLRDEAVDLERAGCFAVVLEAMPPEVAGHITRAVGIPTVGIGAGPSCDGQVLVWHDLLGLSVGHVPLFVKRYADLAEATLAALRAYVSDVRCGAFPTAQHTYSMIEGEVDRLDAELSAPSGTAPRTRS